MVSVVGPGMIVLGGGAYFGAPYMPQKYQPFAKIGGVVVAGSGLLYILSDAIRALFGAGDADKVGVTAEHTIKGTNEPEALAKAREAARTGKPLPAEAPDEVAYDADGNPYSIPPAQMPLAPTGQGIVSGGLAVGVSAQIRMPGVGGEVRRSWLSTKYEIELELANYRSDQQTVTVDLKMVYSTAGFDDRVEWTSLGEVTLASKEVRRQNVTIDSKDRSAGLFELPAQVTASCHVNNVQTQSTYFRMI